MCILRIIKVTVLIYLLHLLYYLPCKKKWVEKRVKRAYNVFCHWILWLSILFASEADFIGFWCFRWFLLYEFEVLIGDLMLCFIDKTRCQIIVFHVLLHILPTLSLLRQFLNYVTISRDLYFFVCVYGCSFNFWHLITKYVFKRYLAESCFVCHTF